MNKTHKSTKKNFSLTYNRFEPGVPCDKAASWNTPLNGSLDHQMEFSFEKSVDLVVTVRVMEAVRFGWDQETGVVKIPMRDFSHRLKAQTVVLLDKDLQPVKGHDGIAIATVRLMARVPAVADDGPVGIGVCLTMRNGKPIVDSLSSNYVCQHGEDPKPGDRVLSINGVDVHGQAHISFARIVALTMGVLGSTCQLKVERWETEEIVESFVERCALDVPQPEYLKEDALTDETQLAFLMPALRSVQVTSWTRVIVCVTNFCVYIFTGICTHRMGWLRVVESIKL